MLWAEGITEGAAQRDPWFKGYLMECPTETWNDAKGYSILWVKFGKIGEAQMIFDEMPDRDVVCWDSIRLFWCGFWALLWDAQFWNEAKSLFRLVELLMFWCAWIWFCSYFIYRYVPQNARHKKYLLGASYLI